MRLAFSKLPQAVIFLFLILSMPLINVQMTDFIKEIDTKQITAAEKELLNTNYNGFKPYYRAYDGLQPMIKTKPNKNLFTTTNYSVKTNELNFTVLNNNSFKIFGTPTIMYNQIRFKFNLLPYTFYTISFEFSFIGDKGHLEIRDNKNLKIATTNTNLLIFKTNENTTYELVFTLNDSIINFYSESIITNLQLEIGSKSSIFIPYYPIIDRPAETIKRQQRDYQSVGRVIYYGWDNTFKNVFNYFSNLDTLILETLDQYLVEPIVEPIQQFFVDLGDRIKNIWESIQFWK